MKNGGARECIPLKLTSESWFATMTGNINKAVTAIPVSKRPKRNKNQNIQSVKSPEENYSMLPLGSWGQMLVTVSREWKTKQCRLRSPRLSLTRHNFNWISRSSRSAYRTKCMDRQTYNSHSPKLPTFLLDIHPFISVWNLMVSTHADLLRKLTVKMPSTNYGVGDFIIVPATGCRCVQFWTTLKYTTFLRTILFNPTSCTAKSPNLPTPFRFSVYIFRKKCYLPTCCANVSPIASSTWSPNVLQRVNIVTLAYLLHDCFSSLEGPNTLLSIHPKSTLFI
jgi:hypothetical protein